VGDSFSAAAPVVVYLAAATAVKALTATGLLALQGMGDARFPALTLTAEAALNLALSIVLGLAMGLEGVALGTLLSAVAVELVVTLPVMCRKVGIPLRSFVATAALAHVPAVAGAGALGVLLRPHLHGVVAVLLAGAAVAGTYVAVFAFTGMDAGERRRLRQLLGRRRPEVSPAG
ncbi:MAG TPA: polysaccharide biosynthesis C-terminal domain-containing protein, partial [Acidimicrobiales bacterium]|nr:polysaccharide biosynthesis C-terminal domain-containing protein [Acidimicrobiales bacterium]